jgi:hypothetical protein
LHPGCPTSQGGGAPKAGDAGTSSAPVKSSATENFFTVVDLVIIGLPVNEWWYGASSARGVRLSTRSVAFRY